MPELILASTSPARKALLDALRIPYRCVSPGVTEDFRVGTPVKEAVALLAQRKASAVAEREPTAFVLGADQLVEVDGEILGKPDDRDAASKQISKIQGRTHALHTAVCLIGGGVERSALETAHVSLYPLQGDELERYLDTKEWEGCAGGYRVESLGQTLMRDIQGDRTNIQGLPMLSVVRLLRESGFNFF